MWPVTDNNKNFMDNLNSIYLKKFKRKNFILFSAVSAAAAYTLLKAPFKLLFSSKKEQFSESKDSSLKVTLNPKAVSKNSKV